MEMSFKERNYSQEGLEAVPPRPSIISQAFFERPTGIRPAFINNQHDYLSPSTLSNDTISKQSQHKRSYLEQGSTHSSAASSPRLICGVPASTLLFAIIAALAIATAGTLGGILGMRPNNCPSVSCKMSPESSSNSTNSTSGTPTTTAAGAFTTDETVPLDCPNIQDSSKAYTAATGTSYTFRFICNDDCPSNDLVAIWTYSIDMCLDACVSFTELNSTGTTCGAATFRSVLSNSSIFGGNCYLKTGCPSPLVTDYDNKIGSAVLLS